VSGATEGPTPSPSVSPSVAPSPTRDLLGLELTPSERRILALHAELRALCREDLAPNVHAGLRGALALVHVVVSDLGLEYEHLHDVGP
jgi:hypothetical protein